MKRKDLENIILEAYSEVLLEADMKDADSPTQWKNLSSKVQNHLSKTVSYKGTAAPGDPERDFIDSGRDTYFFTTEVDKTTGRVSHAVIKLASFENLYNRYSKIISDIKDLMRSPDVRKDTSARELFELIKTNFRKLQRYLRIERPEQYDLMKMRRTYEETNNFIKESNSSAAMYLRVLNENLLDQVNEQEPEPEEAPDMDASKETVLEDSTDKILNKFPTLKNVIIKLQTEDFKDFVDSIDWVSPRPSSFRINLKNGQDYILKWLGDGFQAQIMGKRYFLNKIDEYQQALDKLEVLYRQAPLPSGPQGEEGGEGADGDFGSADTGGGDFPGGDAGGGGAEPTPDAGGEEGGADLTDEPIDFEAGEEPEA